LDFLNFKFIAVYWVRRDNIHIRIGQIVAEISQLRFSNMAVIHYLRFLKFAEQL